MSREDTTRTVHNDVMPEKEGVAKVTIYVKRIKREKKIPSG